MKTTKESLKKQGEATEWSVWQRWGVTNKENGGGAQTNKQKQPTKHRT